jgi:hypothetical protein
MLEDNIDHMVKDIVTYDNAMECTMLLRYQDLITDLWHSTYTYCLESHKYSQETSQKLRVVKLAGTCSLFKGNI